MEDYTFTPLPEDIDGFLIDVVLRRCPLLPTRSAVKKAHKQQGILVNGTPQNTGYRVQSHDEIGIVLADGPPPKEYRMELEVVWQDEDMAVVYKPPGLPTSGNIFKTLQNVLVGHIPVSSAPDALPWARPVHRLDSPTQGLVMVARTRSARAALGDLLAHRQVQKTYHAVVHGLFTQSQEVHHPIGEQAAHSTIESVATHPHAHRGALSLVRLQPHTGRTHQLRIHLAHLGHPILGEVQYHDPQQTLQHKGLFLAATRLQLPHPIHGQPLDIEVPIPDKFYRRLEGKSPTQPDR